MAIAPLLAALHAGAASERDALLQGAAAEAARIEAEARADIARARDADVERRRADHQAEAASAAAAARQTGRRLVLDARSRLLERVLTAAAARLPDAARGPAYRAALDAAVAEALACVGEEPAVVTCPSDLVPGVREAVAGRPGTEVRADEDVTGIRVSTTDGLIDVDHTLAARFQRDRQALAVAALALLDAP